MALKGKDASIPQKQNKAAQVVLNREIQIQIDPITNVDKVD